jgi:shikimate dehydrogenase
MLKTKLFGIIGKPVSHSLSPGMHKALFKKMGLNATYIRLCSANAKSALNSAKKMGLKGINVTAPYKEEVALRVHALSKEAKKIGAVNTVLIGKKMKGWNTDVQGVKGALAGIALNKKKVVVLGSGGAAKAVLYFLKKKKASAVVLNRASGIKKAGKTAKSFGFRAFALESKEAKKIAENAEIIVSCVSTAERILPKKALEGKKIVLQANYSKKTVLEKDAKKNGCRVIGGTVWLLEQGACAFKLFTKKNAEKKIMKRGLKEKKPCAKTIALIGFMGSGKTSVARIIAKKTGKKLVNLDREIEKRTGKSIRKIFEEKGEKEFRKIEEKELKKAVKQKNSVIDCGGGIILSKKNRDLLKEKVFTVWLWVGSKAVLKRITGNKRPLLAVKNRKKTVEKLLKERTMNYAKTAFIVVDAENPVEETVKVILDETN